MGDAVKRDLGVDAAFGGDAHQGGLFRLHHLFIIGIAANGGILLQAVLGQQRFHGLGLDVADGGKLQVVVQDGFDVIGGNAATADERVFHNNIPLLCLIVSVSGPLLRRGKHHAHCKDPVRDHPGDLLSLYML